MPGYAVFEIVSEKATGLRHLQVLMGIRVSEYWCSRFCYDFSKAILFYVVPAMVIFAAAGTVLACAETLVLIVAHLLVAYPLGYVVSTFFSNEAREGGTATAKAASTAFSMF